MSSVPTSSGGAPPPAAPARADEFGDLGRYGIYLKLVLLLVLVGFAAIALAMIESTVRERRARQAMAANEIGAAWGRPQQLVGPVMMVPYRYTVEIPLNDGSGRTRIETRTGTLYALPDSLAIDTQLAPEERYRGIFRTVVYKAGLKLTGSFAPLDLKALGLSPEDVQWDKAVLALGLSDLRGVEGEPKVAWDGAEHVFRPGVAGDVIGNGMNAPVPLARDATRPSSFSIEIKTTGSRDWWVAPLGKTTTAQVASPWPHPSFGGAYLPAERSIGREGFRARWAVSYLGRDYPQAWKSHEAETATGPRGIQRRIAASQFGVSLVSPVDFYQQSERAVKYGLLIVVMILAAIFIYEFAGGARFHLVQYALVGAALCLFFLLLLSFAEIIGFALAYAAAALLSGALIAWYAGHALGDAKRGWFMAALLALVYGFLFVVLQMEDFALVTGALGLFAAVAAAMIASRNVDWYALRRA
jgi:inner membrane protein